MYIFLRGCVHCLIISISAALLIPHVYAQNGFGHANLTQVIDTKIENFRSDEGIVGMTVAISRNGRLIYSKGFGQARRSTEGGSIAMEPRHRSRIGSVSKAIISGPATYQALLSQRFNPGERKVYGANSIFGEKFSSLQRVSLDRFQPVIAMAIAPDDRVYTWYSNGTLSVGTSSNLSAHSSGATFDVAEGKSLRDLHAVAISPESHVYAFYRDGTVSVGTSWDLDSRQPIRRDAEGEPNQFVAFPKAQNKPLRRMEDVVGIGIAKSTGHFYFWYDDGTRTVGSQFDADRYESFRTYSSPIEDGSDLRYRLRGMGIASDDKVYAWSTKGTAFSGHSQSLAAYRSPYAYSMPTFARQRNIYRDIKMQHLFDHTSGFQRSGDEEGAKRLYAAQWAQADETKRYELIHRHFLATRRHLNIPGKRGSYSNHGMGLMTLIIPEITGESYREYTVNRYLKPMGMKGHVRAQKANHDQWDSYAYEKSGSRHNHLEFKNSSTGLSAGGWTTSAQGMLGVTKALQQRHSYSAIDRMGFKRENPSGKLFHNGATGGGYAQLVLFPDDYVSASGLDIAGYHVAVASNTSGLAKGIYTRINQLINTIVKDAARANIASTINYWDQAWD